MSRANVICVGAHNITKRRRGILLERPPPPRAGGNAQLLRPRQMSPPSHTERPKTPTSRALSSTSSIHCCGPSKRKLEARLLLSHSHTHALSLSLSQSLAISHCSREKPFRLSLPLQLENFVSRRFQCTKPPRPTLQLVRPTLKSRQVQELLKHQKIAESRPRRPAESAQAASLQP